KSFQAAGNTESASAAPDTRNSRELTLRRLCGLQRERGHASSHHNTKPWKMSCTVALAGLPRSFRPAHFRETSLGLPIITGTK
ncbi:hypothetical protein MSG28_006946, partial [Choristoneura fumiferana]